jgi:hypothetical protein
MEVFQLWTKEVFEGKGGSGAPLVIQKFSRLAAPLAALLCGI